MIKAAIKKADTLGKPLIMLEGNPNYYSRFEFKPVKEFGISIALPNWAPEVARILPLSKLIEILKVKLFILFILIKLIKPPQARHKS